MKRETKGASPLFSILLILALLPFALPGRDTLPPSTEHLLSEVERVHGLDADAMERIRRIFSGSPRLGTGNPAVTRHPVTQEQCEERLKRESVRYDNPLFETICGGKYMAPLYDPATERAEDAKVCMDQFEFPDIPCRYPVVWIRPVEASAICEAMGKRLCDAHEWEGGCDGALLPPDYPFDTVRGLAPEQAIRKMRAEHNAEFEGRKRWSYGAKYRRGVCATSGRKSEGCDGGNWNGCGSNTFPSGYFPGCESPLKIYDLNGNAAEHMNLPLSPSQMASRNDGSSGFTEMKGSWFVFDTVRAHEDWCRWRAPFWHGTRVTDPAGHRNYHLGFRCCKTREGGNGARR